MVSITNSEGPERTSRGATLFVASLASFLTPFMGSSVNIALPVVAAHFSMSAVMLSWIATAYLLTAAVFLVPMGKAADIYGRKKLFRYGITLYTFSSFLCGIAPSATFLIIFRAIQGVGGAMIFGTAVAILISVFPPEERGRVLGINVAAVYAGLSCGPFVGGLMTDYFGWRSIFLMHVPLGAIILAAIWWKLKGEWAASRGERLDYIGSIIYGISLLAMIYGLSILPRLTGVLYLVSSICGLAGFVLYELKTKDPVVDMNLFRNNTVFAFSNLAALINYSATFALGFLLSLYLQFVKGLSPQMAGLVLVIQPIVMALGSPFAGRLSDRIEPRIVATLGMAVTVIGLGLLTQLELATSLGWIMVVLGVLGVGFALFSSPNTSAIMGSVSPRSYGVSSAMVGTMRLIGQVLSMGTTMLVFAVVLGPVEIKSGQPEDLTRSITLCFTIFSVLCFCGIFASVVRGKLRS